MKGRKKRARTFELNKQGALLTVWLIHEEKVEKKKPFGTRNIKTVIGNPGKKLKVSPVKRSWEVVLEVYQEKKDTRSRKADWRSNKTSAIEDFGRDEQQMRRKGKCFDYWTGNSIVWCKTPISTDPVDVLFIVFSWYNKSSKKFVIGI